MSVDIVLNKANRRYSPGDKVVGTVVFVCKGKTAHKGINLVMEGILLMEVATGVKKAFTFPKPTTLAALTLELAKPGGHLNDGKTEIPFEFTMEPLPGQQLHESFHGECINVRYTITCTCIRGFAKANLVKEIEFLTEVKTVEDYPGPSEVPFTVTGEGKAIKGETQKPQVKVTGKLTTSTCFITQPVSGEMVVESTDAPIKHIYLQLMRSETCGHSSGFFKESSEILRIEVVDGDVVANLPIMLFMILPRLSTCPTLHTAGFKIEFDLNVVVILEDTTTLTHPIPLLVVRN
eukprot:TRINITY_DN1773_c0_g1_i1.p1 TRINITY_DN1773_c0_g1~~TRINITY_DN1773_c0_g1_i1.p1  ORF type:complete len:292 (-),score=39.97 TRINITY_DN1773_c0_g1_i1:13-888(-)